MPQPRDGDRGSFRPDWRRAISSVNRPHGFGPVLVLILITYVLSVTLTQARAGSVVLFVQIATIWLILRTSEAPRPVRRFANIRADRRRSGGSGRTGPRAGCRTSGSYRP